ncbi:hypothetical protein FisN_15Hh325 [Fistulifera solaris]|uniref:Uncharacterized protein n=1 Tax=Fistulifera solaris TaxID=1519565 RepID=A0A1Z5JFR4_FISSO|nr:hypothetical protein FisN_15Hh325 [Fistulifera solaris]|eukprot:GAX12843.1 hypothetical protein FisN_15Hh325 [Fistulifera solaris]
MIEKRHLYSDPSHPHQQQSPHHPYHHSSADEHSFMCKNCSADENSHPMTDYLSNDCFDTRRRPFPTLLYLRLQWNNKCQGCLGKPYDLPNNIAFLDQYATTRLLDMAAEEELEAAQASGDVERIREARTILDFNKKAS